MAHTTIKQRPTYRSLARFNLAGDCARGPDKGIRKRGTRDHEVDRGLGDVDRAARGLPGPRADQRHRVVAPAASGGVHRDRLAFGEAVKHPRSGHQIRHDAVLTRVSGEAGLDPAVVNGAQMIDEARVVDSPQDVLVMGQGGGQPVSGCPQRGLYPYGAFGQLGARGSHADPDLGTRHVQQARVTSYDDGVAHGRSMTKKWHLWGLPRC